MEARPWLLVAAISLSACGKPPPRQQIVEDAAAALGGRERIFAVRTLVLEGEGRNGNLGQDMTPESSSQGFTVSGYKRTHRADAHTDVSLSTIILLDNVRTRGLKVERIVPIHGAIAPFSSLVKAATAVP